MSKQNVPAFPVPMIVLSSGPENVYDQGMTMRQWYKGMALQGILNHVESQDNCEWPYDVENKESFIVVAEAAGKFADAMLAEDAEYSKNK